MEKVVKTKLLVVGNNAVGKTVLTRMLVDNGGESRVLGAGRAGQIIDWVLPVDKQYIEVEIKETANPAILSKEVARKGGEEKRIVLLVIRGGANSAVDAEISEWVIRIKSLKNEATLSLAVTFRDDEAYKKCDITKLRRKYSFIEYFFAIAPFNRAENNSIYDFASTFRQIIENTFSDRLNYARKLIRDNQAIKGKLLDLGSCLLTSLNEIPEIFECAHLETLILSNEWGEFIDGKWVRMTSRNKLGPNVLFSIPKQLGHLRNLKVLVCGGDWENRKRQTYRNSPLWYISDLYAINNLTNLTSLNVSNNEIVEVGTLDKLTNLQKLYLNNNKISELPSIAGLPKLREVYLSNNSLTDTKFLVGSKSLKSIDIHSNRITDLLPIKELIKKLNIKDSKWEPGSICVANNPLQNPAITVISRGKRNVLAYFRQQEAEQKINIPTYKNRDIKLVLAGNSTVGKSTLLYWLKNKRVKKAISTTHWLVVDQWEANQNGESFNVRVFDFGGQEYYHDTHHLFFTNRTAYLILWDNVSNVYGEVLVTQTQKNRSQKEMSIQTFPIEYWLDSIKFHTSRKPKTKSAIEFEAMMSERDNKITEVEKKGSVIVPTIANSAYTSKSNLDNILIVQNKVDSINEKRFVNQEKLKADYNKIFDFASVSIYNNIGLSQMTDYLFAIFQNLEVVNDDYLGTWGYIKKDIEANTYTSSLTIRAFREYCNATIKKLPQLKGKTSQQVESVLFSESDTTVFAQFLNDIGLLLFFPENDFLRSQVFLNQDQVLRNIYKILQALEKSQGEFNLRLAKQLIGKDKAESEVVSIIQLMLHFKIIFMHPGKQGTYIAPLYLPEQPVQSIALFSSLFSNPTYRFYYDGFIHKHVILDFFHHYGKKALKETESTDLYYYWKNGIIVKDEVTGEIVMVKFHNEFSDEIRPHVDVYAIKQTNNETLLNGIVQDLEKINLDWHVRKCVTANGEDYIPLEKIHESEQANNWLFKYGKKYFKLGDFKKYLKNPVKMKKIFVSYSKLDLRYVNKFIEHLSALQLDGKVSHWYCSELEAGSDWNSEIQQHFDSADIVCFMVSPNFMKTSYIHEHEIEKAFKKKDKDPNFKIVPIILDFCRWATTKNDLSKFTALPYTTKPVADFPNENMAWYIIQEALRLMIDHNIDATDESFYSHTLLPPDVARIFIRIVENKVDKNSGTSTS